MELDFIASGPYQAGIVLLITWVVILGIAKALKLEKHGFKITPYSLTYKNTQVQTVLSKMLTRTKRGIRVFADVSVIAGFLMMGYAFWFLFVNMANYFTEPTEFLAMMPIVPGVTVTSWEHIFAFLLAIPIVLVVHEGAHGIVATLEKIKIKTGGVGVIIALFYGFVEPDEEEFDNAKKISKLRVIGAGATSNVIFAILLGAIMITNPVFGVIVTPLPAVGPVVGLFYESSNGMMVTSLIEGGGAEQAGIHANDIIINVDSVKIITFMDLQKADLKPGQKVDVTVLRDGQEITFPVSIMASPDDPEQGLIGIMRDGGNDFKPIYNYIEWDLSNQIVGYVSLFLVWLWVISFFIGILNMLPLPILDGGKFIHSIIYKKISEKSVNSIMIAIYAVTFILFVGNIALTYVKEGWFTI
jgi:membrane-associated protease RseP (regulator of RpoE activity)